MGKNLVQQARGKGSPTYRAPSFRYKGEAGFRGIENKSIKGMIIDLVKCPGHSAPLAEVKYEDGCSYYHLAPEGIKVGDSVECSPAAEVRAGNIMSLKNIPEGTFINNVENHPGDGGKFCRAAGTFAKILSKSGDYVNVQLPSKKEKELHTDCRACIGILAGGGAKEKPYLKAGKKCHAMRAKNKYYPHVSGLSQNAVDHPFGGSSSHSKGKPQTVPKNAPPGRKVGKLRASRTGRRKR